MRIGFDIRPLLENQPSGVGEYTRELLTTLLAHSDKNEYHLFANAAKLTTDKLQLTTNQAAVHHFRYPNKILNASMSFFNRPTVDRLIGSGIDLFFMPNLNFVALSDQIPLVLTIHDLSFHLTPNFFSKKQRLWHQLIKPRFLAHRATRLIAQSEHTKNDLICHFKIPAERISVIYPGLASEFFETTNDFVVQAVKRRYRLPDNFILFLATLEPRKNIASIIEAFQLLEKNPNLADLHLVLAGRLSANQPLISSRKLENKKIQLLNYVAREDRPALYRLARVFVYPSYYEGFGLPPLEAQAAGTPVVASYTTSLGEVLGQTALLIDPYNVEDLRQALETILTDEKLAADLRRRGQINAHRFHWDRAASQTLKVFNSITTNH